MRFNLLILISNLLRDSRRAVRVCLLHWVAHHHNLVLLKGFHYLQEGEVLRDILDPLVGGNRAANRALDLPSHVEYGA